MTSSNFPLAVTNRDLNITVDSPGIGNASQFIAHGVDTQMHHDFIQFVHDMPQGMMSDAKFRITHELMTLMGVPFEPTEYSKHRMLKLPYSASNKRNEKVCAFLRQESAFTDTCSLRAFMLLFTDLQGIDKVQLIILPNSSCTLCTSSKIIKNKNPWNRILNSLNIAPSEISHSTESILQAKQEASLLAAGYNLQLEQPEQTKQRSSHMPLTLMTNNKNTNLSICKTHLREGMDVFLQQYVTACKQTNCTSIEGLQERIMVSDDHYIRMRIEHLGRICCSLHSVHEDRFISSTTVNFAKKMVFATIMDPEYTNVFGLQKIALMTATKVQSVLTPEFLANYVISKDPATTNLLQLMLSHDLHDEIRQANVDVLKRVTDFVLTDTMNYEDGMKAKEHVFQNSSLYTQNRLRVSIACPIHQKADRSAWLNVNDKLSIDKMVAARGVATAQLVCNNMQVPVSDKMFAYFSGSSTARMVCHSNFEDTVDKRTYTMWHEPRDSGAPQPLSCVMNRPNPQFFFTQSQISDARDLKIYRQHNGTNTLIAEFKDNDNMNNVTYFENSDRNGPLICALLDAYGGSGNATLYQTALVNLLFRTSLQHQSQEINYADWLDHFQNQWIQQHYQSEPVGNIEANTLYLEYSMFSECLKRNVQGLHIPADVFSLVAQEVLPFQWV